MLAFILCVIAIFLYTAGYVYILWDFGKEDRKTNRILKNMKKQIPQPPPTEDPPNDPPGSGNG